MYNKESGGRQDQTLLSRSTRPPVTKVSKHLSALSPRACSHISEDGCATPTIPFSPDKVTSRKEGDESKQAYPSQQSFLSGSKYLPEAPESHWLERARPLNNQRETSTIFGLRPITVYPLHLGNCNPNTGEIIFRRKEE